MAADIRSGHWGLLPLVGRERVPNDWICVAGCNACGFFWLGLVAREKFDRHGSWLSAHVRRVRSQDLTLDWCKEHLLSREPHPARMPAMPKPALGRPH